MKHKYKAFTYTRSASFKGTAGEGNLYRTIANTNRDTYKAETIEEKICKLKARIKRGIL